MSLVVTLITHDFDIVYKYSGDIQVKLLKHFSNSKHRYVRYWVAKHPNTPVEILHKLSGDEDSDVISSALNELKARGIK